MSQESFRMSFALPSGTRLGHLPDGVAEVAGGKVSQAAVISAAAAPIDPALLGQSPGSLPADDLFRAIAMDSIDGARQALQRGGDPNARLGAVPHFPLLAATRADRPGMVRLLLRAGADPSVRDVHGRTPLIIAARSCRIAIAKALIVHGADINARDSGGQTALMEAARNRHSKMVTLLLRYGAQSGLTNRAGETALMQAADAGDYAGIEQLVRAGADLDARDLQGRTALDRAARRNRYEALSTLVCFGRAPVPARPAAPEVAAPAVASGRVEATTTDGQTALMLAARAGDLCLMDLLIRSGVQLDKQDGRGETALMKAAYYGQTMAVDLLLARGADVHIRSHDGDTAAEMARKGADAGRHAQVIASLSAASALPART